MPSRGEKIEVVVTSEQMLLFRRAADLMECSLPDFIVSTAETAAEEALRNPTVIKLSPEDSITFVEALLNPDEPNENLRAAARHYWEFFGESPSN